MSHPNHRDAQNEAARPLYPDYGDRRYPHQVCADKSRVKTVDVRHGQAVVATSSRSLAMYPLMIAASVTLATTLPALPAQDHGSANYSAADSAIHELQLTQFAGAS